MITGWGNYPSAESNNICAYKNLDKKTNNTIPIGYLRSYGDEAMAIHNGLHVDMKGLNHFIDFDEETGVLTVEAGIMLKTILDIFAPRGWFLPCVPGTSFVSIGGAIANDIHGKNHANVGSFGDNVLSLNLARSDGTCTWIHRQNQRALFSATIGGLGLTGFILAAKIQLRRIKSGYFNVTSIKYNTLDEFYQLCIQYKDSHEYNVAWVDCSASDKALGRGHFIVANHADDDDLRPIDLKTKSIPITPPISLINGLSIPIFNTFYYHRQLSKEKKSRDHYQHYLFPLDAIYHWNRLYGKHGFVQHQCVIPRENADKALPLLLRTIKKHRSGSFLAVLKEFGHRNGPGLLSFARPGITLAIDFAVRERTFSLLNELDAIVADHQGAIYLAKDAHSCRKSFEKGYPKHEEFKRFIDPAMTSLLSQRIGLTT